MLFARKPKNVIARLIDLGTGREAARIEIAQDALPASWEIVPTIEAGKIWQILDAQPMLAADVVKTGQIELLVRTPPNAGPDGVYAEPTIAATLPPILPGSSKVGVRRFQLLPEDWRQIEFVSNSQMKVVDKALASIRDVLDNHAVDGGYDLRYERAGIDAPIAAETRIPLEAFEEIFEDGIDQQSGVAILGVPGLVDGGFAFTSASLTQYFGFVRDGAIAALCIGGIGSHEYDSPEVQSLADFAFDHDLTLVEWTSATKRSPDSDEFFQLFDTTLQSDDTAPV